MEQNLATIRSLADLSRLIDDTGNIRGADVEAHRIAALVDGGMGVDEVLEDYPNLGPEQIDAAVRYAKASPEPERPFPTRTAKSVLRGGGGGGGGLAAAFAAASDDEKGA